jgi:hypothetical protein
MKKFGFDMKIAFEVRLAAMSMLGLGLLNATHWARGNFAVTNSIFEFLLGIAPNVAAGYAMPLILASFMPKVAKNENKDEARKIYLFVSAFTTFGLIAWEFIQVNSKNLYFDTNDIVATFVGTLLAYVSYLWLATLSILSGQDKKQQI